MARNQKSKHQKGSTTAKTIPAVQSRAKVAFKPSRSKAIAKPAPAQNRLRKNVTVEDEVDDEGSQVGGFLDGNSDAIMEESDPDTEIIDVDDVEEDAEAEMSMQTLFIQN